MSPVVLWLLCAILGIVESKSPYWFCNCSCSSNTANVSISSPNFDCSQPNNTRPEVCEDVCQSLPKTMYGNCQSQTGSYYPDCNYTSDGCVTICYACPFLLPYSSCSVTGGGAYCFNPGGGDLCDFEGSCLWTMVPVYSSMVINNC